MTQTLPDVNLANFLFGIISFWSRTLPLLCFDHHLEVLF